MIIGFSILILAGICQGSFGLGYKKYPPFSWEAFWFVYMALCAFVATLCTFVLVPNCLEVYSAVGFRNVIFSTLFGVLWGISAIFFSMGINLIGMSLLYGISSGVGNIVGSLSPIFLGKVKPEKDFILLLLTSIILAVLGIAVITKAGLIKEQSQSGKKKMKTGLLMAVLAGLGNAAQNAGFSYTDSISLHLEGIKASLAGWMPILIGGCFAGCFITFIMMIKNKTLHTLKEKGSVKRTGILFFVSIIWFTALALYGLASYLLGEKGSVTGWLIFNVLALLVSNALGILSGEWKNNKKALKTLFIGCFILTLSIIVTAISSN